MFSLGLFWTIHALSCQPSRQAAKPEVEARTSHAFAVPLLKTLRKTFSSGFLQVVWL